MLEKILGKDPDEVFPYQTERILIIRDLLLAIIGYIFSFAVIFYIVFYVCIMLEKYNAIGTWNGYVYYRLSGKAYSISDDAMTVWDHGDISYPEQDSKSVMIGIFLQEIQGQEIGNCIITCSVDSDCPNIPPKSYSVCTDNGYCDSPSWCPNPDVALTEMIETDILGIETFTLSLWAGIEFPQFSSPEYVSYSDSTSKTYPDSGATIFILGDLLKEAGVDNIEDLKETGAIIDLNFNWECDASINECTPVLTVEREDSEKLPIIYK